MWGVARIGPELLEGSRVSDNKHHRTIIVTGIDDTTGRKSRNWWYSSTINVLAEVLVVVEGGV